MFFVSLVKVSTHAARASFWNQSWLLWPLLMTVLVMIEAKYYSMKLLVEKYFELPIGSLLLVFVWIHSIYYELEKNLLLLLVC